MRSLSCAALAAAAAVAASPVAGALRARSPSPAFHPAFVRGTGAKFWLDADTCVIPHVNRSRDVLTQAVDDEAIVRLQPGASVQSFVLRHGLSIRRSLPLPGAFVVRADPSRHLNASLGALTTDPSLRYAEPNRRVHICAVPNDPKFTEQWGMSLAQFPAAWDIQKGTIDAYNPGVVVGVIDTGISPTHPDLAGRLAPGGKNFVDPTSPPSDDNGHGTHIAGIIAATTNNGVGVAGGTWEGVQVLDLKAFDASGSADIGLLAQAIMWAGDQGLKVVNLSAGTTDDSPTTRDAVTYFLNRPQHPILVCAAGNDSDRTASPPIIVQPLVPARYPDPRIIGVAGVGRKSEVAWYSDSGAGVDIAAPGGDSTFDGDTLNMILSTIWDPVQGDGYGYEEGTSMAAPHVSAAVALLLSEGLATDRVEQVLYQSSNGYNGTRSDTLGYGVLNTAAALNSVLPSVALDWPNAQYPVQTTSTSVLGRLVNAAASGVSVNVDGKAATASVQSVSGGMRLSAHVPLASGSHTATVTVSGALTGRPYTTSVNFTVQPKLLTAGWHMFSLPYAPSPAAPAPSSVFSGQPFKLDRWMTDTLQYAVIDAASGRNDVGASFAPPNSGVSSNPVGLGYWVYLPQDTTLTLSADPVVSSSYSIPMSEGWSQVGDPYVFPVRLADAHFQTGIVTVSVAEALSKGWLRPFAYRLNGSAYDQLATGDVVLQPWESIWIRAGQAGTLVVPATPAP
jgi:subtilisin family serine protease